jgi:hypothetical protein
VPFFCAKAPKSNLKRDYPLNFKNVSQSLPHNYDIVGTKPTCDFSGPRKGLPFVGYSQRHRGHHTIEFWFELDPGANFQF